MSDYYIYGIPEVLDEWYIGGACGFSLAGCTCSCQCICACPGGHMSITRNSKTDSKFDATQGTEELYIYE